MTFIASRWSSAACLIDGLSKRVETAQKFAIKTPTLLLAVVQNDYWGVRLGLLVSEVTPGCQIEYLNESEDPNNNPDANNRAWENARVLPQSEIPNTKGKQVLYIGKIKDENLTCGSLIHLRLRQKNKTSHHVTQRMLAKSLKDKLHDICLEEPREFSDLVHKTTKIGNESYLPHHIETSSPPRFQNKLLNFVTTPKGLVFEGQPCALTRGTLVELGYDLVVDSNEVLGKNRARPCGDFKITVPWEDVDPNRPMDVRLTEPYGQQSFIPRVGYAQNPMNVDVFEE